MTACLVSLGCPKNLVDSEVLLGYLGRNNFILTDDIESADVVIITTCSFIHAAVIESSQKIKEIIRLKRRGIVKRIVVVGCLVQRLGDKLKDLFPEVDSFLGIDQLSEVAQACGQNGISHYSAKPGRLYNEPRLLSTPGHYAYLKISDGCDNRCSYCLIPQIRGRFRSRPETDITAEAKSLARLGVKELILVGQDTTRYGFDRYREFRLAGLLKKLAKIEGISWIRLLYTHPAHYTDELITVIGEVPEIVKYLDLPLQHIADPILRRMNRHYTRKQVETLLAKLHAIPGMKIRTTFITGFPGETRKDFKELYEFIRTEEFDSVGVFPYSREENTPAFGYKPQVSEPVRLERTHELMHLQKSISRKKQRQWIGKTLLVLVDGIWSGSLAATDRAGYDFTPLENSNYWERSEKNKFKCSMRKKSKQPSGFLTGFVGRAYFDSPEIDGRVFLKGSGVQPGDFVRVKITRTATYDRLGEIADA